MAEDDTKARFVAGKLAERRWKQADLVRETGLDKNTISDFVSGKRQPSLVTMHKVEDALGLTRGTLAALGEDADGRPAPTDAEYEAYMRRQSGVDNLTTEELLAELTYRVQQLRRRVQLLESKQEVLFDPDNPDEVAGGAVLPLPTKPGPLPAGNIAARRGRKSKAAFDRAMDSAGEESQDEGNPPT